MRARARLRGALRNAPDAPVLRDVQHALAVEYGFAGWAALKRRVAEIEAQRGQSPRDAALQSLLRAADRGDAAMVAEVLDAHPDIINERGTLEGHTGLRTALHFGVHHEPVVRLLLERGADPNIRDEGDNAFPLHFAAERGDLPVIGLLVEHGAQTVAGEVDDHELDIIGWATAFEDVPPRPEVVAYLLAHGARHTMFSAVATGATDAIRDLAARVAGRRQQADGSHESPPAPASPGGRQEAACGAGDAARSGRRSRGGRRRRADAARPGGAHRRARDGADADRPRRAVRLPAAVCSATRRRMSSGCSATIPTA